MKLINLCKAYQLAGWLQEVVEVMAKESDTLPYSTKLRVFIPRPMEYKDTDCPIPDELRMRFLIELKNYYEAELVKLGVEL